MKKISAVLLVMVLVGSVVFAGFTGNADVSFGAGLDSGLWGFGNTVELTSDVVISETLVDNAGDGDIWAEIAAELTFGFDFEDAGNEFDATGITTTLTPVEMDETVDGEDLNGDGDALDASVTVWVAESANAFTANAEITSAKIASDDWYVSILGSMGAPNFAASVLDAEEDSAGDDDGDGIDLNPSNYVGNNAGVEVGLSGYAFGLSVDNTLNAVDGSIYNMFASVTTPEFVLGDGLTVALGAAGLLSDSNNAASASATVAYGADMMNATVSTDMIFDGGDLKAEVAVAAAYDAYSLDVYYATEDDSATYDSDDEAGYTAYTETTDILSAKIAATVADVSLSLTGLNLVHAQDLTIAASYPVSDMLTVGAEFGYVVSGLSAEDWNVGVDATYTTDMYTLAAAAGFNSAEELSMSASIESTTMVPGATLSLVWEDGNYLNSGAASGDGAGVNTEELGSITASASIAF
ncbi:MAG: hypothetical protein JXK93_01550 [Sphaerochaetaceae bacterium]|nr:hypothetical protein [Sphaerochaetaceae bacterium]